MRVTLGHIEVDLFTLIQEALQQESHDLQPSDDITDFYIFKDDLEFYADDNHQALVNVGATPPFKLVIVEGTGPGDDTPYFTD